MKYWLCALLFLGLAACSPTTDISRTSTENSAGRTTYRVARTQVDDRRLTVQLQVDHLGAWRTVAEDVVVKKWRGFDAVEVKVYGPEDSLEGSPRGTLDWSPSSGFQFKG